MLKLKDRSLNGALINRVLVFLFRKDADSPPSARGARRVKQQRLPEQGRRISALTMVGPTVRPRSVRASPPWGVTNARRNSRESGILRSCYVNCLDRPRDMQSA
jgi:hypothetical protein